MCVAYATFFLAGLRFSTILARSVKPCKAMNSVISGVTVSGIFAFSVKSAITALLFLWSKSVIVVKSTGDPHMIGPA